MKKNKTISTILIIFMALVILAGTYMGIRSMVSQLLVITNSGSTNFPGYTLMINSDGSGKLIYAANSRNSKSRNSKSFIRGTFSTLKLKLLLSNIGDVSKIPIQHMCIKSISFGSATTVTYNHITSGDISCIDTNASLVYKQFSDAISQIQFIAFK